MFWDRFYDLCIKHGTKPLPVVKEIGVATGSVTKWKNGASPNSETLLKIAQYFDVSTDYLLGNTDDMHQKQGEENIKFTDFTYAMHNEEEGLTDEDKQMLLNMARMLRQRVKEKEALEKKNSLDGGENGSVK